VQAPSVMIFQYVSKSKVILIYSSAHHSNMELPTVSVIIPTKNSSATLERTLKSIHSQTYPAIEIIVVDNFSTDGTHEVAEGYADSVFEVGPERTAQKNFGAAHAKGKYVYIVDSDFVLGRTVVEEAALLAERGEFDGVLIHNTSDPTISFWSKVRKLERDCYRDDPVHVAVRFIRHDFFNHIGGFDETMVAMEDYELHKRFLEAGGKLGYIGAEEVHIGEPQTLGEVARGFYYYGKTLSHTLKKSGTVRQSSPFRGAYIRHWRDFASHPILTVGFLVYNVVKFFSALAGFVAGKTR